MTTSGKRVGRNVKLNQGRIMRAEQRAVRLEKRIDKLEKQQKSATTTPAKASAPQELPPGAQAKIARLEKHNEALKAEVAKLAAKVAANTKQAKVNQQSVQSLLALKEPVQALVRSFKQTPGAPFAGWCAWMLSTFRKQGIYRKRIFK